MTALPTFVFSDDLVTGISDIDNDHRQLFALYDEARSKAEQGYDLGILLDQVGRLANAHFSLEEDLMRRYRYDAEAQAQHQDSHNFLIADLELIYHRFKEGRFKADLLLLFLQHWIEDHIRIFDIPMAAFLRKAMKA